MRTNKLVWKIVSVVIALAMVVTLLPTGFIGNQVTAQAVSVGDEMFSSFSSTSPTASAWYDYSSSTPGWAWGANQSADGYASGLAFEDWFLSSGTVTGYAYYTVSSMPAGTYTLSCTVDSINIGSTSSKTTIYPYVGGSQVTSYSIAPYVSSTWSTSASVSNGSFSYTFTLDSAQTNYAVGFYVAITAQQQVHLNDWSLTCDSLDTSYELVSASTISGATVAVGATTSEITSALASSIDVKSTDGSTEYDETLSLTWDLSDVDTATAGTYTATYSYTSEYIGTKTGDVDIVVMAISSDKAYKDIVTGSTTTTDDVELEWGSGNVPGTFESGTMGTSGPSTSGIYASSSSYVSISTTSPHNGSQHGRITGGSNYKSLYINGSTSAASSSTSLSGTSFTWSSFASSVSYSEATYTFTPTATTYYLNIGLQRSNNGNSKYVYMRVKLVGVDTSKSYTCTFYYAPVKSGNSYYVYIDDIVITYEDTVTVDETTRAYYDYAGTYTVDSASVEVGATATEVAAALPTYITADLVLTEYEDDEDYNATQALPVTWDTSSVSTASVGSYTVSGTASYGGDTIDVTTTLKVTQMVDYIEYEETGLGSFENDLVSETNGDGEWTFVVDNITWDASVVTSWIYDATDTTADNYDGWTSAKDGSIVYKYWMNDSGVYTGAYKNDLYDVIPSGTYNVSFSHAGAIGAEIGLSIRGYVDGEWTIDYYPCTTLTNTSLSTFAWTDVSTTVNVTKEYTMAYIGFYVYSNAAGAWGNIDAITVEGPEAIAADAEVINADNPSAVDNSDGEGWALTQLTYKTDSYSVGASYDMLTTWYWDDTTDDDGNANYTEYDYGIARYGTLYTLEAGTYTWEFNIAGSGVTVYPYIIGKDGTATTIDEGFSTDDWGCSTYETAVKGVITFDIDEDMEDCYVGLYVDTSTSACWASINGISIYYGEPAITIYDDQIYNGTFNSSAYGWSIECENSGTGSDDGNYGYTVETSAEGDGKSLNTWCNTEDGYYLEFSQFVRLNTAGDYKLIYDTMGWLSEVGNVAIEVYTADEEGNVGDAVVSVNPTTACTDEEDEWYAWTTYETESFEASEGDIFWIAIYGDLSCYEYLNLDNILIKSADYVIEDKTFISVDDFTNGGWDIWGSGHYWTVTGEKDSSDSAAYGYKFAEWEEGDENPTFLAWNNDTAASKTYTLVQQIEVTKTANYVVEVDSRGWLYDDSTATVVVTDENGTELTSFDVKPSGTDAWTSISSDAFEIEADTIITVTVTVVIEAASVGGQYDSDGDGTDDTDWYKSGSIALDNFELKGEYIAIDDFENGDFEDGNYEFGNYWTVTGDIDSTNYYYGYSILDDTWSDYYTAGTASRMLNVYNNNGQSGTYTFTMTQKIKIETLENNVYKVQAEAIGAINGSVKINVYNESGSKIAGGSIDPSSTTTWDTFTTGGFEPTVGDVITVEFVITYDEPTSYTGDDGNTYYTTSTVSLDNICLISESGSTVKAEDDQIGFTGLLYTTNSNGVATTTSGSQYFNGGNLVKGVDVSSVISLENAGVTFSTSSGVEQDLFQILADNGVNYIRIRVWNAPWTTSGAIYGGGNNDANVATAIAQRAADVGLAVYIDFMLSDWWADPSYQVAPKAWASYSATQKASAAYTYVYDTLGMIAKTGVEVGLVSIGNETNTLGIAGINSSNYTITSDMTKVFISGMQAITAFNEAYDQSAWRMLHVAPSGGGYLLYLIQGYASASSELVNKYTDIFGFSCYPYYTSHCDSSYTLATYISQANSCSTSYSNKPIAIVEYDWPYTWTDTDSYGTGQISNSTSYTVWADSKSLWAVSEAGQTSMVKDMILLTASGNVSSSMSSDSNAWKNNSSTYSSIIGSTALKNCIGSFYWEGAWIGVGSNWSSNSTKWDKYGCGTATVEGSSYESWGLSSDGGTVHDILSFFDISGSPLSAASAYNIAVDTTPLEAPLAQVQKTATNSKYSLRFVGGVDTDVLTGLLSSSSAEAGFKLEYATSSAHTTIANKASSYVYTSIKVNGTEMKTSDIYDDDTDYLYTYTINNIPTGTTYYWKVTTYVKTARSYQESIKYYKTTTSGTSVTLTAVDAWDYPGYNAELDGVYTTSSGGTTNSGSGVAPLVVDLYPSYMQ